MSLSCENSFILLSAFTPGSKNNKKINSASKNHILTLKKNLNIEEKENNEVIDLPKTNNKNSSPVRFSIISISSTDESMSNPDEELQTSITSIPIKNHMKSDDSGHSEDSFHLKLSDDSPNSVIIAEVTISSNTSSMSDSIIIIESSTEDEKNSSIINESNPNIENNCTNNQILNTIENKVLDESTIESNDILVTESENSMSNERNVENSFVIDETQDSSNILVRETENSLTNFINKSDRQSIQIDETKSSINSNKILHNETQITNSLILARETENSLNNFINTSHYESIQIDETKSSINSNKLSNEILIPESDNNIRKKSINTLNTENSSNNFIIKSHYESIQIDETKSSINSNKLSNEILIPESDNNIPKKSIDTLNTDTSLMTSDNSDMKEINEFESIITLDQTTKKTSLLTSDESNIETSKLHVTSTNCEDVAKEAAINLLTSDDSHNTSASSDISYKTASNVSTRPSSEQMKKFDSMETPKRNNTDQMQQTPIDRNTELILDELYGDEWRNSIKTLPRTEPKKNVNRRLILEKPPPKTERKVTKSIISEISTTNINFKDFAHKVRPDFESTRTPIVHKKKNSFIVNDHDPEIELNNTTSFHNSIRNQLMQAVSMENYKEKLESPCIQRIRKLCDPESDENSDKENANVKLAPQIDSCSFSMEKLRLSENSEPIQMEKLKLSTDSSASTSKNSIQMGKLQLSETPYQVVEILTPEVPKTANFNTPNNDTKQIKTRKAQTTQGKRKLFCLKNFDDENSLIFNTNEEFPELTRLTYSSFVQNTQATNGEKTYIDLAYEQLLKKLERKQKLQNKWKQFDNLSKTKVKTTKKTSTESNQSESLIPTTKTRKPVKKSSETHSDNQETAQKQPTKTNRKLLKKNSSDDEYIPTPIRNKIKTKINKCRKYTTESSSSSSSNSTDDEQEYKTPTSKMKNYRRPPISRLAHLKQADNDNNSSSSENNSKPKSNYRHMKQIIVLSSDDDDDNDHNNIQNQSDDSTSDTSFEMPPPTTPASIKKNAPKAKLSFLASLSAGVSVAESHPDAAAYKLYFNDRKEELATRLFTIYNETIFDDQIPKDTPIEWNVRMRGTAGFCYNIKKTRPTGEIISSCRIVLSSKVIDHPSRLRDTLIHEMCHAATWIVNRVKDGHGPYWKSWAVKAMRTYPELPRIKRCHDYQINTKYTYKCTSCGYSIGRHSKSLDVERKRCGYCYGQFELLLNKKLKNGAIKTIATPKTNKPTTGFAKFVKENYNTVKNSVQHSNIKHGDIMKLLGQQFSTLKMVDDAAISTDK